MFGITGGTVELIGGLPALIDEPTTPGTPIWQFANANVSIEGTVYPDIWGGGVWNTLVQETQAESRGTSSAVGNTFTTDAAGRGISNGSGKHITLFRSKAV